MFYAVTAVLLAAALVAGDCSSDNCLRSLRASRVEGRLEASQEFCASYVSGSSAAADVPSYAAEACRDIENIPLSARVSSACHCIGAADATGTETTGSSSSTASLLTTTSSILVTSTATPTTTTSAVLTAACALVSSSSSAQRATAPSATPTVPAQLAYDCLQSVPLNKTAAIALVDSIGPYIEWQSDIAFKKDPPASYFYPPHDIFGYLASIKTNLAADKYANEYAFQADLYQVFARGHDGHFIFYPDALTKAFDWARKRSLVSISEDGTSLPVIKIYEEVMSSPATASVVSKINGVDAATYVGDFAFTSSFNQDADAAYNSMFFEKAFVAGEVSNGYFSGGGRMRYIYPGPNTTFTFANGTVVTLDNVAKVKGNFASIVDGPSFFKRFCSGALNSNEAMAASAAEEEDVFVPTVLAPGYPPAVIISNDSVVSGYYLDGAGFEDVAVFSALAFESESITEFQEVAQKFFAGAVRDGKTKLVIDLSANGGGYILQGYDLFRQLFPQIVQDGFSRFRENEQLLTIASIFSNASANFDPNTATNAVINKYETFFNYRYDLNLTNQPFESFGAKFDPHVYKGDNYTNILRWNLDDPLTTSNISYGLGTDVTGYGSRKNFTQPFKAENIIMLLDGYCASTCTLFTEFMRTQAKVKSIAMGGRPKAGPIQGVGGIKGAEILSWQSIYNTAQQALPGATPEQTAILKKLKNLPINRSSNSGCNVRDAILPENVNDGLPAQFVREEADCRLYYTQSMITDVTALWKAAANAAFNGAKCAAGSLPRRSLEEADHGLEKRAEALSRQPMPVRRAVQQKDAAWVARHGRKVIA